MLPSAQLDRFLIRLSIGYPDRAGQVALMKERHHANPLDQCRAIVDIPQLQKLIQETEQVYVSDAIYEYITDLAEATRANEYIQLGVSPRGALSVCRTAKACAYLEGRDYVIPEDVQNVFADVCAHRLVMRPQAQVEGVTARALLEDILTKVRPASAEER